MRGIARWLVIVGAGAAGLASCSASRAGQLVGARLSARPSPPVRVLAPGTHPLELSRGRDGFLFIPASVHADSAAPLIVMLHGAGGSADRVLAGMRPFAEEAGVIVLAPDSRGRTWDVLQGGYGPDIRYLDQALVFAFEHARIDPRRLALAGFSDGASYALSVGLSNGDLFTHVFAFSPGFLSPSDYIGKPSISIWHGTQDAILPIDVTSRRIVPELQRRDYEVEYAEFDGPHAIPADVARAALARLTGRPPLR